MENKYVLSYNTYILVSKKPTSTVTKKGKNTQTPESICSCLRANPTRTHVDDKYKQPPRYVYMYVSHFPSTNTTPQLNCSTAVARPQKQRYPVFKHCT